MRRRGLPGVPKLASFSTAVGVIGFLATFAAAEVFRRSADDRDVVRFDGWVEATQSEIAARLETYIAVQLAGRGLFASQEAVTPEMFRRFVAELALKRRYPGVQGVGFARRLAWEERAEVEEELRAQGRPEFRVWPEGPRAEVFPIAFLEPMDARNRAAIGYDMFSEPVRREAMVRARDSGRAAASGKVTLVQEIDEQKQAGFLIYMPVYRGGGTPETVEERRKELLGFVYSPFRMDDLLAGIFGRHERSRVAFSVYDGSIRSANLMHRSAGASLDHAPRFTRTVSLDVAGRPWSVVFHSQPALDIGSTRGLVPFVWIAGLVITGLAFGFVRGRERTVERELATRRRSADEREELLRREQIARAEAESASRAKDEFLAILGHELRNPLAPIVTAVDLLRMKGEGALPRELELIERQTKHLAHLVDDLLDVARITQGKMELERRPVDLAATVARAVEMTTPLLDERNHHLELQIEPGLVVLGDEVRLVQVVTNLLSNAAKFTEPGGNVAVSARREGEEIVLSVRDDGMGIAPALLPRVFDTFTQGPRIVDRSKGGLGLGLSLVRSLVEAHGGRVCAASEGTGRGTTIEVRLPKLEAKIEGEAPRSPAVVSKKARCLRTLVVDDNEDAAESIAAWLRAVGHDVRVAYDGPQALEIARRFTPEVALLDLGLPGMDGYEVGMRLRRLMPLRLIAITGYGQERDRDRTREAGFECHLVKPVSPERVLEAMQGSGDRRDASPPYA